MRAGSRKAEGTRDGASGKSDCFCSFYLSEEKHRDHPRLLPYRGHIQSVTNSIKNTLQYFSHLFCLFVPWHSPSPGHHHILSGYYNSFRTGLLVPVFHHPIDISFAPINVKILGSSFLRLTGFKSWSLFSPSDVLGKLHNLSVCQFPYIYNGDNGNIYLKFLL